MDEAFGFIFSHKTFISLFLGSLFLALVLTPLVARLARLVGAVDQPNHRKLHKLATPQMGGLAVYLALWLPILGFYFWQNGLNERLSGNWRQIAVIALTGLIALLSGVWDDIKGLNATKKLLIQIPVAILFVKYVAHFSNLTVPVLGSFDLGVWGAPLTILWIVGVTNALNLVDGIDGLATGITIVIAFTNSIIALAAGNDFLAVVMLGMAGACLGFLYYNFAPAKIFLGDTGSLFLGMTLATTSVLTFSKGETAASFLVAVVVLGYPVMDTLLAMTRRKIYGKPMFSADMGHIHHRLLAKGLDHPKAALAAYALCAGFSLLALALVLQNSMATFFSLVLVAGMISAGLYYLDFFKLLNPQEVKKTKAQHMISYHLGELLEAKLSLADSLPKVCQLFYQACWEYDLVSIDVRIDPALVQADEQCAHFWTNPRQTGSQNDETVEKMTEVFTAPEGWLEVQVEYNPLAIDEELRREYSMQLSRLTNSAAVCIKELLPTLPQSSKQTQADLAEEPERRAETSK